MKLSLKFKGDDDENQNSTQITKAKVPITIFNTPFISGITATTSTHSPSDFSFSLSTNFPSGPSLKLSYSPTSTSTSSSLPFSLSLKSGLGIFGSPRHSPLVFSANFSLSPSQTPLPSFSLHFKPQFGHFSLHKTVFSDPNFTPKPSPSLDNPEIRNSFVPDASSSGWHDLKLEPCGDTRRSNPNCEIVKNNDAKYGLSPGVGVMAKTVMPMTKGFFLNFRWGVTFPGKFGSKMPYLTVNKIGLEKVEEVKDNNNNYNNNHNEQNKDTSDTDLQLLKGMCFWMRRDLEVVEKENKEMKRLLDEMRTGVSSSTTRNHYCEENNGVGKKLSESSGEFQRWRSNKSGRQEDEKKQANKSQSVVSDVESELQKAIKAATTS